MRATVAGTPSLNNRHHRSDLETGGVVQFLVLETVRVVFPSSAVDGSCLPSSWLIRPQQLAPFLQPAETRVQVVVILHSGVFMYSWPHGNQTR
jgi:hypothetical protein